MKSLLIIFTSFFISISASANLISESSSFGVDTITRDTETNLKWLDLSFSAGFTYQYVDKQLAFGGKFYGYRFASVVEVISLLQHAGISKIGETGEFGVSQYDSVNNFLNLIHAQGNADPANLCKICNTTLTYAFTSDTAADTRSFDSNGLNAIGRVYSYIGVTYDPKLITMLGYPSEYFGYANPSYGVMSFPETQITAFDNSIASWLVSAVPEQSLPASIISGVILIYSVRIGRFRLFSHD